MPSSKKEISPREISQRSKNTVEGIQRILRSPDPSDPRTPLEAIKLAETNKDLLAAVKLLSPQCTKAEVFQMLAEQKVLDDFNDFARTELIQPRVKALLVLLEEFSRVTDISLAKKDALDNFLSLCEKINQELMQLQVALGNYGDQFSEPKEQAIFKQRAMHLSEVERALIELTQDSSKKLSYEWFSYFVYEVIVKDEVDSLPIVLVMMLSDYRLWNVPTFNDLKKDVANRVTSFFQKLTSLWNRSSSNKGEN